MKECVNCVLQYMYVFWYHETMTQYKIEDTNKMSWEEVTELIDIVQSKTEHYFSGLGEKVSIISPILRTGGIVGSILAINMKIIKMLPVQFKYQYNPIDIKQMITVPDILSDIESPVNILLCDGNTGTGTTAVKAAKILKEKYPTAKVYLATLTRVFGCAEKLEGIEEVFYGRMTEETYRANEQERKEYDLRPGITVFPWEKAEDELKDVNGIS